MKSLIDTKKNLKLCHLSLVKLFEIVYKSVFNNWNCDAIRETRFIFPNIICWENLKKKHLGDLIRMRTESTHIRE